MSMCPLNFLVFYSSVYLATSNIQSRYPGSSATRDSLAVLRGFSVCGSLALKCPGPAVSVRGAPVFVLTSVAPWLMDLSASCRPSPLPLQGTAESYPPDQQKVPVPSMLSNDSWCSRPSLPYFVTLVLLLCRGAVGWLFMGFSSAKIRIISELQVCFRFPFHRLH